MKGEYVTMPALKGENGAALIVSVSVIMTAAAGYTVNHAPNVHAEKHGNKTARKHMVHKAKRGRPTTICQA